MVKRHEDLSAPRAGRRLDVTYDSDVFGQFSESIARYLGTARFLVWQTGIIIVWIAFNTLAPDVAQFDPWAAYSASARPASTIANASLRDISLTSHGM